QVRPRLAHARQRVEHAFIAHIDIAEHEVALAVAHPLGQRADIAGGAYVVALLAERLAQHEAQRSIVVGQKDASAHGVSSGSIGRRILKAVRPGALSTSMRPSWRATMSAATVRPRPMPLGLVVAKASNRRSTTSG